MDNKKRNFWPLAVIEEILFGRDGVNRLVKVKTAVGTFLRPIQKIYPLEISSTAASSRLLNDKEKTAKIQTRSGRTVCIPNRLDDYYCFSVCLEKNRWRSHNDGRRCSKGQSRGGRPIGGDTGGTVTKIPANPPQKDNNEADWKIKNWKQPWACTPRPAVERWRIPPTRNLNDAFKAKAGEDAQLEMTLALSKYPETRCRKVQRRIHKVENSPRRNLNDAFKTKAGEDAQLEMTSALSKYPEARCRQAQRRICKPCKYVNSSITLLYAMKRPKSYYHLGKFLNSFFILK
ncbi:hypothetical protein LAZ67_14001829 [Cordylochernes scorpioides]|uniref:DUF5641 domain-containing protein n=1 Tax=Cordylochernes scorpioides TaxID=51811 RepID=A0ABY6L6R6_9ARAC|nr:hypothetical protein LAZ67_14001829 [Cordylochernes scorpioides]